MNIAISNRFNQKGKLSFLQVNGVQNRWRIGTSMEIDQDNNVAGTIFYFQSTLVNQTVYE